MIKSNKLILIIICIISTISLGSANPFVQQELDIAIEKLANKISQYMAEQKKTKIAVVPFQDLSNDTVTTFGKYIAEELTTALFSSGKFNIVERNLLNKVLDELKLAQTGAVDPSSAKELGKITGVDAVVTGTIQDLVNRVAVNCRLIETQTGNIFAAASEKITKDETISTMLSGITQKKNENLNKSIKTEPVLEEKREWIVNQAKTTELGYTGLKVKIELKSIKKLADGRIEVNFLFTSIIPEMYNNLVDLSIKKESENNYIADNNGNRFSYIGSAGINEEKIIHLAKSVPYAAKLIYPKFEENTEVISLVLDITDFRVVTFTDIHLK